ncbi:TRAP transporter small permease [Rhodobacteraceae bacterium WD3A24]|nr:TRAP transporter small permease [Rhodobacteraceae bacterium WD3A24]
MSALARLAERMAQTLALVGAVGVLLMMVHVGIDVAARNIVGRPLPATNEIVSRYYMVLIAFLPLAWVERRRGMVSVEVVDAMLGPRITRVSDVIVALLACAIYAVMTYTTWETALSNWGSGSSVIVLNMLLPVWPTYFLPPAGFALAALVTAFRAVEVAAGTEGKGDGT